MNSTDHTMPPERLAIAEQFFFRLQQCANMLQKTGTRVVGDEKLTTQQCAVLGALTLPRAQAGMSVGELTRHLMVSRQNLAGVISRMERAGFLAVAPDERDRRSRLITITQRGRGVWEDLVTPKLHRYYDQALSGFQIEDINRSLSSMLRLLDNMAAMDSDFRQDEEQKAAGGNTRQDQT